MNSPDDELGYVRRYAAVMQPETVYDRVMAAAGEKVRAMDAQPEARKLRPVPMRRAARKTGDLRPVPILEDDEGMQALRALAQRPHATDTRPESDLDFYTRCAAESCGLA